MRYNVECFYLNDIKPYQSEQTFGNFEIKFYEYGKFGDSLVESLTPSEIPELFFRETHFGIIQISQA